jgi:hypothetical protein
MVGWLARECIAALGSGLVELAVGVERTIHQSAHSMREHLKDALR